MRHQVFLSCYLIYSEFGYFITNTLSSEQNLQVVHTRIYYQNKGSVLGDALRATFTFTLVDKAHPERRLTVRNDHSPSRAQQLKQAGRTFSEWPQNETATDPYFHKKILFTNEANLKLNGYVNK